MKTLLLSISLFLSLTAVFGQNSIAKKAPLNPLPLEELAYMVPSLIDGDIAYYKGHFYNDKREQLLENGESFRSYANWTEKEAYEAKSIYMAFDASGKLLKLKDYKNFSTLTRAYTYNQKGLLTKSTFYNDSMFYHYDNKDRLLTEERYFSSSKTKVVVNYNYKTEDGLLKITRQTVYPTGKEQDELHYKNGKLMYYKSVLGEENVGVPDAKGNITKTKNIKTNKVNNYYYNVIYNDEINTKDLVVVNAKKNDYDRHNLPRLSVGDKIISNVNLTIVGNHVVFYIPTTQQYFIAKNFYNSTIKKDEAVNVELLQENNPYLHIWGNDSGNFYCLYKGSDHSLKKFRDENYSVYYSPFDDTYFLVDKQKNTTSQAGTLANVQTFKGSVLMYVNYAKKTSVNLFEGENQTSSFGWSAKPLNVSEAVMLKNNEPKYIIPIVPKPDDLKIYLGRKYNNEVISN
ncbi:hypothetical protein [Confluentibacter sediminis]|uniref:hypothetical protein n=1 Tax=Confluentibacter sediminis TaxID=2219045 RepID=UPI000DAEABCD|nr:hypothetical protein [Confluentibacter sediminis]